MNKLKFTDHMAWFDDIDISKPVMLLEVFIKESVHMSGPFAEYISAREDGGSVLLHKGRHIILLLIQNGVCVACNRSFTAEKAAHYFDMRGRMFLITGPGE